MAGAELSGLMEKAKAKQAETQKTKLKFISKQQRQEMALKRLAEKREEEQKKVKKKKKNALIVVCGYSIF